VVLAFRCCYFLRVAVGSVTYVLLVDILGALAVSKWESMEGVEGDGMPFFSGRDYSFGEGGVVVPERFTEGLDRFMEGMQNKLGGDSLVSMMRPVPGQLDRICIENPIRNFNGISLPSMRACLDFDELAQQWWVMPLRLFLLFIIVCLLGSSVYTIMWRS
jgi:hypothetical protein